MCGEPEVERVKQNITPRRRWSQENNIFTNADHYFWHKVLLIVYLNLRSFEMTFIFIRICAKEKVVLLLV